MGISSPARFPLASSGGLVDPSTIQPCGDRVLVRRPPDIQFNGLLHIVGGRSLDCHISEVIARGPDVKARPWELQVGDYVLHTRVAGVKYDGADAKAMGSGDLCFLQEKELIAVIPPELAGKVTASAKFDEQGVRDLSSL